MDATPAIPDIQATFDYWATIESNDLTEIANDEAAIMTEQAIPPVPLDGTFSAAGVGTPTSTATTVAYQLPNTGSGAIDGGMAGFVLLIGVLLVLALSLIVRRVIF